jgi:hypothetical protein
VNGFIMDIRNAPLGAQVEAYRKGMIPYIPEYKENGDEIANAFSGITILSPPQPESRTQSAKPKTEPRSRSSEALQALYVLEVAIIDGSMTEAFVKKNRQVARTIEIRGDQTLADLHSIIFKAFDRFEEHAYEFQLRGKRPNDPNADRYGLAMAMQDDLNDPMAGEVAKTKIGSLELTEGEPFGCIPVLRVLI